MAHGLLMEKGRAAMFYVGDAPWHGLGTALNRPATAEEAIRAAGLDWRVVKVPLYVAGGPRLHQVPGKFAMVREDRLGQGDCPILGMVGEKYKPFQNAEAFQFFDPVAGKGAAIYHTAGALGDGERVWILARLPDTMKIVGDDTVDKYLLLSTSHDGTSAVQIKFTPIRVVCQNTLGQALSRGTAIRVAHNRDIHQGLREAQQLVGFATQQYSEIERSFQQMAKVDMDSAEVRAYLEAVFPMPKDETHVAVRELVDAKRALAEYFFDQGAGNGMKGVQGTLWAAYNGVAELVDHSGGGLIGPMAFDRGRRPLPPRPNGEFTNESPRWAHRRLESVWFGEGYRTKVRAFKEAETLMDAR